MENPQIYRYSWLVPISMIYIAIMIFSDLLVNKPVSMHFGFTTAATIIFPLWFMLNDVIAEIYDRAISIKILITGFMIQLFFNVFCYGAIHLPSPANWNNQAYFDYILGHLTRTELSTFVAFMLSGYINIHLLTKWKVLVSGKYFWLRCIGSSLIGEGIYSLLNVWPILFGFMTMQNIFTVMVWSYLLKIIYTVFLAYPLTLLVAYIKKTEGIDVYEMSNFNPFLYVSRVNSD